jgi:hypothetical protein
VLRLRKVADRSTGVRIPRWDPETGERKLINPLTPGDSHEPWPLAGVQLEGEPPKETAVSTSFVSQGRREGWLTVEGEKVVHRPGGPPEDMWRADRTYTFQHYDTLVFKTLDGDVRYKVTKNPDKFVDSDDPEEKVTKDKYESGQTRVDHFYCLALEN